MKAEQGSLKQDERINRSGADTGQYGKIIGQSFPDAKPESLA